MSTLHHHSHTQYGARQTISWLQHVALEHSAIVILHGADGGQLVPRGQRRSFGATGAMAFSWLCATGPLEAICCGRPGASGGQLVCATGPAEVIRGGRRGASGGQLAVCHGASGGQLVCAMGPAEVIRGGRHGAGGGQ